jgi:hypothetical protein
VSGEPLSVDELERWTLFGARWELVELAADHAVIDMCTCTDELVARRRTEDPEVVSYLRAAAELG